MGVRNVPRRVSRNLAFQVLYGQVFLHATSLEELSRAFKDAPRQAGQEEAEDGGFAWELVEGVWSKRNELDEQIRRYARNWRLERVGRVELTLLRLALYEVLFRPDVPHKVAINEALELNRQYGEEKAQSFINGVLDAAVKGLENAPLSRN